MTVGKMPLAGDEDDPADVIIVGAGVAGATVAQALAATRNDLRVIVLERGVPGRGDEETSLKNFKSSQKEAHEGDQEDVRPYISGSAVFNAAEGPPAVKMMIGLYAATSSDFLLEHDVDDAKTWFSMTSRGLGLQKRKAAEVLPCPNSQLRCLGSIMVAPKEHEDQLEKEYELLKEAGANVRKMETNEVLAAVGHSSGFTAGLEFPDDAIIDSSAYSQYLLKDAEKRGRVVVRSNSSPVEEVLDGGGSMSSPAVVRLGNGEELRACHVVIATGAFYRAGPLSGILKPCYSYLVALPADEEASSSGGMKFPHSPNIFTFGFSHDWCIADGICRMSGEDHFSALKLPHSEERCKRLAEWTFDRFPQLDRTLPYASRYGVYSETPDLLPIFGKTASDSQICYLVGCNAWGQAVMSCLGHLVPATLGFRPYEDDEEDIERLCSIQRFPVACEQI